MFYMFAKSLRKFLALLLVYAVIIVGIFVFQFKNDSIISEKLGSLHVTLLSANSTEKSDDSLKNKFNIMYNGISFAGSDERPATAVISGRMVPVYLVSWKKKSPLLCEFNFTNGITISYSLSDESSKAYMVMEAKLPENVSSVSVPYSLSAGTAITDHSDKKLQLLNKKLSWELTASDIDDAKITLTRRENSASYSYFDAVRSFSFDAIIAMDAANESNYINTVENLKSNLISLFSQVSPDSTNVSEQEAVSYVAAMAEKGKYNEALDAVPQTFKKSATRTFLSGPYFDTLVKVNETLQRHLSGIAESISASNEAGTIDVFATKYIADYMCMHPGSSAVTNLLKRASEIEYTERTVQQATAVLTVYDELADKNPELANLLRAGAQKAVEKIQASCAIDDNNISISEKGIFLSVVQAVQTGDALLRYGKVTANPAYQAGGRLIVSSYLKESGSFDLRTLSDVYPIIVHNNTFYPHFEVLSFNAGRAVWAWTCASNIAYENDNAGTITLTVDFPLSYTHYIIVDGIDQFQTIYIYDIPFRTDYRFETYNSSGYVYQKEKKTLLLKSRHKSQMETIRLVSPSAVEKVQSDLIETKVE
ncbi:MAG: hypothetical protein IIT58_00165 [Treponema sp.]|nr:hypothetical protein [Treponema sp.]